MSDVEDETPGAGARVQHPRLPPADASSAAREERTNKQLDLAAVTVASRLPEFWADQPRHWFLQVEAILNPSGCQSLSGGEDVDLAGRSDVRFGYGSSVSCLREARW